MTSPSSTSALPTRYSRISGTGSYLPPRRLTNADLTAELAANPEPAPVADAGVAAGDHDAGPSLPAAPVALGLPMFMGDPRHTGRSPYQGPAAAPTEAYHYATTGRVFASIVLHEDTAYVASLGRALSAVGPDGSLRWRYSASGRVYGTPAVAPNGTVYVASDDGWLTGLRPATSIKEGVAAFVRWYLDYYQPAR